MRAKAVSVRIPEVLLTELYALAKRRGLPLGELARELMVAGLRSAALDRLTERVTTLDTTFASRMVGVEKLIAGRMLGVEKLLALALWKLSETVEWCADGRPEDEVERVRDETERRVLESTKRLLGRDILE